MKDLTSLICFIDMQIRFSHECQGFIIQPICIYEQVHKFLIFIAYAQKPSLKPVLTYLDGL